MKVVWQSEVSIDLEKLAEIFANLDDDSQAQFFVYVAKQMRTWPSNDSGGMESQAQFIGGHLRNCSCSTEDARQFVLNIAYAIEHSAHGAEAA